MQIPLYKEVREIHEQYKKDERVFVNENSHRGLYFDKFFDEYTYSGKKEGNWKIEDTAKSKWIKTVSDLGQCGNEDQLKQQLKRLLALADALGHAQTQIFETTWHFATGLGLPHPVENGLIWHPTLGVPYLPASSIKGLLKAWQRDWADESQDKIDEWFGTQEKAGKLIFFDAIPIKPVTLIPDVMTPHYGKWYEQGNEIEELNQSEKIPADWHNPVPVPFLAVKDASFLFVIMPRNAADAKEAENAMTALTEALKTIGAGAKTAVGYGYFEPDENAQNKLNDEKEALEKKRQDELLSPEEKVFLNMTREFKKHFNDGKYDTNKGGEFYKFLQMHLKQAPNWSSKTHQQQFAQCVETQLKQQTDWWKDIKKQVNALKGGS
ncbi:MAG: type module protein Cmr6 [Pseudomonadota bacterium]|jgi:CRISPR-associated protein Cmr6